MTNQEAIKKIIDISGVNPRMCMHCGKCSGTCPAYNEMEYHPHQFVDMIESGNIEPLLNSESLYMCLSCFECVERCPRGVEPANIIEAVRLIKIRQSGQNHIKAQDIPNSLDDKLPQQALVSIFRKYKR